MPPHSLPAPLSQVAMEATVLQPVQQGDDESRAAFVQRVQRAIADEAGLVVSECTISVKKRVAAAAAASAAGGKKKQ